MAKKKLKLGKKEQDYLKKRSKTAKKAQDREDEKRTAKQAAKAAPKIDVDEYVNEAAWIIAQHGDDALVDDLISDLDMWREELEAVVAEHGTGLTFGQLTGSMIADERKYLKKKK